MSGIQTFEPYGPPSPSIAVVCRDIDEVGALRAENRRLRHEKANALAAAEAERAESARLRRENQGLATDWAAANNDLAGLRDALTAAVGVYDCPCGEAWEFDESFGIEDFAALNTWLGRHNSCAANLAAQSTASGGTR